jgi:hypothetical protein
VAAVVCGGVFIDLDKNGVLVSSMLGDPVSVDEYLLPAHVVGSPGGLVARQPRAGVRVVRTVGRNEGGGDHEPNGVRLETTGARLYIRRS